MVSRRNFFTITILMFIIFFMCMFSNNLKDMLNDYTVNIYTETAENYPSQVNIYVPWLTGESGTEEGGSAEKGLDGMSAGSGRRVVFIGAADRTLRDVVWEWVAYSKRDMAEYRSLAEYGKRMAEEELPEMLVIDSASVDWTGKADVEFLVGCVEQGINLVFPSLPEVSVISENRQVRELLGIREVVAGETSAAGLHLYDDFLLGGETRYLPREEEQDEAEEKVYLFPGDTDASGMPVFPWYLLSSGTKVYMKGIPEDEAVKTEDYPVLIWRKSFGTACVFAVNGGYMEGIEGLGILSAMAAQMHPYEIYPVLNAQNMVLAEYPGLADENGGQMERLYTRSMTQLFQEILWPNTWIVMDRYHYKITCMLTPQYDYSDAALPDAGQLEYYLKTFREEGAEAGISGLNVSGLSAEEKMREDGKFLQEAMGGYDFASFYAGRLPETEIEAALEEGVLSSVRTVIRDYEEGNTGIVGFLSEYVTSQTSLNIGLDYTYRGDFLVRSLETALGYLNISYDMARVAYPESDGDAWEKLTRDFGITVSRYAGSFGGFEATTAAECDVRIRNFLALDYQEERSGDMIRLHPDGAGKPVWFVLRTHNEAVESVEGGSWKRLEAGAYLIGAEAEEVVIRMKPLDERYYY